LQTRSVTRSRACPGADEQARDYWNTDMDKVSRKA
jgi:hypothetical protein